jgi:hypothetical protein
MKNSRSEAKWDRWGAATGYLAFALGIGAVSFERGAPPANAPVEQSLAYFVKYRAELQAQSLLFVLSAGILWAGLQMVMQGGQVALAMGASAELPAALAGMMGDLSYALSVIAYVPMGIMPAAVAVASWRFKAFPSWLAWLSAVAASAKLLMSGGIVANSGPLVPGGVLTYLLYLLQAAWQVAAPTVMLMRLGRRGA